MEGEMSAGIEFDVVDSSSSRMKTSIEVLEEMAKEFEDQEVSYEVIQTDSGLLNAPTEYLCKVSIGARHETAAAHTVQMAKLLAAQKVLDTIKNLGFDVPEWKRVDEADPSLDPVYMLQFYCRGSHLEPPSYQYWKVKLNEKTVHSYRCFWRDHITEGKSQNRYVAQALAAVEMLDHVVMMTTTGNAKARRSATLEDYISVKPTTIAKMLSEDPNSLEVLEPGVEAFPVFAQPALRPGDPDLICRYGIKSPTSYDLSKPRFVVEYLATFTGTVSDARSAMENCIAGAAEYAEKLAASVQQQSGGDMPGAMGL